MNRQEVLFVGIGGKGVLTAGLLLAEAAFEKYPHVAWVPNYTTAMRAGECECLLVFGDKKIASPILHTVSTAIVLDARQEDASRERVRSGGLIVVEDASFERKAEKRRITRLAVPGVAVAGALGDPQAANLVLLGAYVGVAEVISPEFVERRIEARFAGRGNLLAANKRAFQEGVKLGNKARG